MKNTFWSIFVIIIFTVSCSKEAKNIEKKATSLKYLGEVALSHGDLLLSNRGELNKVVGQDSLLVYDQNSRQLVLIDLKKKIPIHTITVTLDGPNFFDLPFRDAEIRNDSLYLLSKNFFSVYNLDGKALIRFGNDDLGIQKLSSYTNDFQLLSNSTVLISKVPIDVVAPNFQSPEKPKLFFTLDLPTGAVSEVAVFSPKESLIDDKAMGYYNDIAFHSMVINYDSIVYSFPFSSKTFIYDMGTKEQTEIETPLKFTENLRAPITAADQNGEKWIDYVYSGSKFSAIEKDSKTGFYVRVGSQYKKMTDGVNQKSNYLMLLNERFEVIEEVEIEDPIFINTIMVSNGIIYLRKGDQPIEDSYSFVAFEIVN
ncbi:DUF4221 family protein [Roseivirga echinicomitans]